MLMIMRGLPVVFLNSFFRFITRFAALVLAAAADVLVALHLL